MSVSVLMKNVCSTVGEGPHWQESIQRLMYVDIMVGDLHMYDPVTGEDVVKHFNDTVSFVVPRKSGGYVIGHGREVQAFDWQTGKTEVLGEVDQGTGNRFNDAKCDASGRMWAGTMGAEISPGVFDPKMGSLFSVDKDKNIKKLASGFGISNGLAWSADNKTMYFIDSVPRLVYAYDFDITSGSLSNQRVVVDYNKLPSIPAQAFPDGMCIDLEGKLWVANFNGNKVSRFDPATGQEIGGVIIPACRITSCCFGGKNYDEMFVTCAKKGADQTELEAYPLTGSVFKVTGLGVKGAPAPEFAG